MPGPHRSVSASCPLPLAGTLVDGHAIARDMPAELHPLRMPPVADHVIAEIADELRQVPAFPGWLSRRQHAMTAGQERGFAVVGTVRIPLGRAVADQQPLSSAGSATSKARSHASSSADVAGGLRVA
jgi:hypothetical protein